MGLFSCSAGLPLVRQCIEQFTVVRDERLVSQVCGLTFLNPVGLAAGFDKDARWFHRLDSLGFGAVEIGSITGQGQPGNPTPRLFRLPADQALINRMGFNNQGANVAEANFRKVHDRRFRSRCVLGINLGKSKVVPLDQAAGDYGHSFRLLYPFADYFVINVSSPNTPGLRDLQDKGPLLELLQSISQWNSELGNGDAPGGKEKLAAGRRRPVFLKIAPDLTDGQLDDIIEIVAQPLVDGVIATNTTISRVGLKTDPQKIESIGPGGLSGKPLLARSREVVGRLYQQIGATKPVIGVGGIFNGSDAWEMITSGASLVQLYTGFIYGGPSTVKRINLSLLEKLKETGLDHISQAVGLRYR
jgi:dihydroorotate dehydrogenase